MSQSAIQCRACQHVIAKRHHSGNITTTVGIRTVVTPDGQTKAVCPCGHKQVLYTRAKPQAA